MLFSYWSWSPVEGSLGVELRVNSYYQFDFVIHFNRVKFKLPVDGFRILQLKDFGFCATATLFLVAFLFKSEDLQESFPFLKALVYLRSLYLPSHQLSCNFKFLSIHRDIFVLGHIFFGLFSWIKWIECINEYSEYSGSYLIVLWINSKQSACY